MKKINFLGLELNVPDQQDIDQAAEQGQTHPYICIRVADANPRAGTPELRRRRLRTPCERCWEICYFDPKSLDSLRGMTLKIICMQCAEATVREENQDRG